MQNTFPTVTNAQHSHPVAALHLQESGLRSRSLRRALIPGEPWKQELSADNKELPREEKGLANSRGHWLD